MNVQASKVAYCHFKFYELYTTVLCFYMTGITTDVSNVLEL